MSTENRNKPDDLKNSGFTPLTEEEELHIAGGIAAAFHNCPPGYHWNANTGKCQETDSILTGFG